MKSPGRMSNEERLARDWPVFSIAGLAVLILALVREGEQPLPLVGLLLTNIGLWTNIIVQQRERKVEKHE